MDKRTPEKVIHGGRRKYFEDRCGLPLVDFSASLNPFPPSLRPSWDPDILGSYPDDRYQLLKETIGRLFARPPEEITVGNGSIELIRVFCASALRSGDRVFLEGPTFGEYLYSARLNGAEQGTDPRRSRARFLCNPNNPTGTLLSRDAVLDLLESVPSGGYLFVDEAFIELSDPDQTVADRSEQELFVARSLTKAFAVPGIRMGYGFGPTSLVERMEALRLPWTISATAEAYALQAFRHYPELKKSREAIERERDWLVAQLASRRLSVHPGQANFLLADVPLPATDLTSRLLGRGILVRDCTSFGLPFSIRVAVRGREENIRLVEALDACLP